MPDSDLLNCPESNKNYAKEKILNEYPAIRLFLRRLAKRKIIRRKPRIGKYSQYGV